MTSTFPAPRPARWPLEPMLPALLALAAFALLFVPSLLRWQGFGVQSFDFGIYAHGFWHAAEGHGFVNSIEGGDHLKSHASPALYALLPFYALAPSPLTLLALSSALLALAVVPLWALARRRLGPAPSALVVALFVAQPAVGSLNFDLHEVSAAVPLLLTLLWAVEAGSRRTFLVALLAVLTCKENVALVTAAVGLTLLARPGWRREGVATLALSLGWMAFAIGCLIPLYGGHHGDETMVRYAHLGQGWAGLLASPFARPVAFWGTLLSADSALYLGKLLVTWGFLPLLAPRALLVAAPILAQNLLSAHAPMRSLWFHYEALLLPALAWGTVQGLARLQGVLAARWPGEAGARARGSAAAIGLGLACLLGGTLALEGRWGHGFWNAIDGDPDAAEYAEVLARIPPGASVAAPQLLQPYLADRPVAADFGPENPDLRERSAFRPMPPYEWLVVPTAPTRAGAPQPGFEVADLPGYDVAFQTAHLALLRRRSSPRFE